MLILCCFTHFLSPSCYKAKKGVILYIVGVRKVHWPFDWTVVHTVCKKNHFLFSLCIFLLNNSCIILRHCKYNITLKILHWCLCSLTHLGTDCIYCVWFYLSPLQFVRAEYFTSLSFVVITCHFIALTRSHDMVKSL